MSVFDTAWAYDLENGTIAIGWTTLGDISSLDKDQLRQRLKDTYTYRTERSCTIECNMLWRFYHEIALGDRVIASRGRSRMLAIGTVTQAAFYNWDRGVVRVGGDESFCYPNFIGVNWTEMVRDFDYIAFARNTLTGPFDDNFFDDLMEGEPEEEEEQLEEDGTTGFPLEGHLEEYIMRNFDRTFQGQFALYVDTEDPLVSGRQYPVTNDEGGVIGRIDILVRELSTNNLVVVELKRGVVDHRAIAQLLWYMGWVKSNLCQDCEDVQGLIVCTDTEEKFDYAHEIVNDRIRVKKYTLDFRIE
jgi:restriction system protein